MSNKTTFDFDHPAFTEARKIQDIMVEAVEKTARKNLETSEKLLELNSKRFSNAQDFSNPSDYIARQSAAFKDYTEQLTAHFEALTDIGNESREALTEVGQKLAGSIDVSSMIPGVEPASKPKAKSGSKAA